MAPILVYSFQAKDILLTETLKSLTHYLIHTPERPVAAGLFYLAFLASFASPAYRKHPLYLAISYSIYLVMYIENQGSIVRHDL